MIRAEDQPGYTAIDPVAVYNAQIASGMTPEQIANGDENIVVPGRITVSTKMLLIGVGIYFLLRK